MTTTGRSLVVPVSLAVLSLLFASPAAAGESDPADAGLPVYLRDRGEGMPTSLFGTYVRKGELLVYAFYEYTRTGAYEYKPSELGFAGDADYLGKLSQHEALLFVSYGLSERLSFELEAALWTRAEFTKAGDDPSAVPGRFRESGLGDVEGQLRWRWLDETEHRPALYSFFEPVVPHAKDKALIGTPDWELSLGLGVLRGFRWGSLNGRAALTYDRADGTFELGEYGVEYLKRVGDRWRLVAALEGESDELSVIGEAQWRFAPRMTLKLNNGFGLTEKTPDLAPEIGILISF